MNNRIENFIRRSVSIPIELDELIKIKFKRTGYSFKNDFIVELLELGLLKLEEDSEIKSQQQKIIDKLNKLLEIDE